MFLDLALEIDNHPRVRTDGSAEVNNLADVTVAGAGAYLLALALAMQGSTWGGGVAADCGDAVQDKCRVFVSVPGPLQTVQRAEFWGAILALQAFCLGILGW